MTSHIENNKIKPDIFTSLTFICFTLLAIATIVLVKTAGEDAIGYAAPAILLFVLFEVIYRAGFEKAIYKMIRLRLRRNQFQNAVKNMNVLKIVAIVSGVVITALMMLLSSVITEGISGSSLGQMILFVTAPAFLFTAISCVYRGYLYGLGYTKPYFISTILQIVISLIVGFVMLFFAHSYGVKVADLVHVESISSIYAAAGFMSGLSIGSFASMVYVLCAVKIRQHEIKMTYNQDNIMVDRTNEGFSMLWPLLAIYAVPVLLFIVDEIVYSTHIEDGTAAVTNFGIFLGRFVPVIVIFVMIGCLPYIKSWYQINVRIDKNDIGSAGNRFCGFIVYGLTFLAPLVIILMFMADTVTTCIYGKANDAANGFMFVGSGLVLFISLFAFLSFSLYKQGRDIVLLIASAVSVVAHIVTLCILTGGAGKGLHAVIAALYAQFVVYDLIGFWAMWNILKLRRTYIYVVLFKVIVCSVITGTLCIFLDRFLSDVIGEILTLMAVVVVYIFVYLNLLTITRTLGLRDLSRSVIGRIYSKFAIAIGLLREEKSE